MDTELQKLVEKMEVENILAKWAAEAIALEEKAKDLIALAQEPGDGLVNMDLQGKKLLAEDAAQAQKKIKSPFGLTKRVAKPETPIRYLNPSTSQEEKSTKSSPSMPPQQGQNHDLYDLF